MQCAYSTSVELLMAKDIHIALRVAAASRASRSSVNISGFPVVVVVVVVEADIGMCFIFYKIHDFIYPQVIIQAVTLQWCSITVPSLNVMFTQDPCYLFECCCKN